MWVCQRHQSDNQVALNKFKDDERNKHSLEFGLFTATFAPVRPSSKTRKDENITPSPNKPEKSTEILNCKEQNHKDLTQDQALSKLKRKLNTKPETRDVKLKMAP